MRLRILAIVLFGIWLVANFILFYQSNPLLWIIVSIIPAIVVAGNIGKILRGE